MICTVTDALPIEPVVAAALGAPVFHVAPGIDPVGTVKLWRLHRSFGHMGFSHLKKLLRSGAIKFPEISYDDVKSAELDPA